MKSYESGFYIFKDHFWYGRQVVCEILHVVKQICP